MFCFFAVWAGAQAPPKQQKKKTRSKGAGACFVFAVWAGGVFFFFAVWAGGVFLFLLFGRGRVLFLLFGRGACSCFCCLGRGRFFFLLFGRGTGVHSLTRLPGSSLSDPTTKETEQQKKKHGFRAGALQGLFYLCFMRAI